MSLVWAAALLFEARERDLGSLLCRLLSYRHLLAATGRHTRHLHFVLIAGASHVISSSAAWCGEPYGQNLPSFPLLEDCWEQV